MAINALPPTVTSGNSLKQYQLQIAQENGWAPSSLTANTTWQNVVYGAGLHVACANTSLTVVNTSPDGITWTARTVPGAAANWTGLSYGGGYFVLTSTTNRSAYSTDGINWMTGGTLPTTSSWTIAAYGAGLWGAYSSSAAVGAYSTDHGITWASTTQANMYACVSYGAGIFVGIVAGTSGNFSTSSDGITWTDRNSSGLGIDTRDLTWSGTQFVGPGYNNTSIVRSNDGLTWTRTLNAMPYGGGWSAIEWGGGRFVAANTSVSAYSLDGVTWLAGPLMNGSVWGGMSYGGGKFVAVPQGLIASSLVPFNSWTCPTGVVSIDCLLVGAGGAGGSSSSTASAGGGGGGQYIRRQLTVTPGTTYTVIIGSGGIPQGGSVGINGMDSTFGNLLTAIGGGGGGPPGTAGAAGASGGGGGATGTAAGAGGGGGAGGPATNIAFSNTNPTVAGAGGTASAGSSGSFGAGVTSISGSGGAGINGMAGGGGGGSSSNGFVGSGSSGGGRGGVAGAGVAGLANTGGGGGGAGTGSGNLGGYGGTGYCLITWWA